MKRKNGSVLICLRFGVWLTTALVICAVMVGTLNAAYAHDDQDGRERPISLIEIILADGNRRERENPNLIYFILLGYAGTCYLIWRGLDCSDSGRKWNGRWLIICGLILDILASFCGAVGSWPWQWPAYLQEYERTQHEQLFHSGYNNNVIHKLLTASLVERAS